MLLKDNLKFSAHVDHKIGHDLYSG